MDPRRARIATVKQDFARLALGLFAASPAYPLTFSYAAIAEAPQGRADVLDIKGEGTFALRYFVNNETKLPVMVTWTTPPTNVIVTVPGQPPPKTVAPGAVVVAGPPTPAAGAPKEEMDKYTKDVLAIRTKAQATPVEHRLYFADYRDVDGLRLPFRLRRAIGSETTEETTFDRFRLNAQHRSAQVRGCEMTGYREAGMRVAVLCCHCPSRRERVVRPDGPQRHAARDGGR